MSMTSANASIVDRYLPKSITTGQKRRPYCPCRICGSDEMRVFGMRIDGSTVLQCIQCGMGILDRLARNEQGPDAPPDRKSLTAASSLRVNAVASAQDDTEHWAKPLVDILAPGVPIWCLDRQDASSDVTTRISHDVLRADVLVVTGFYETARDFAEALSASLDLLTDDGLLLFEVPILDEVGTNAAWLDDDLAILHYPSIRALQLLVEGRMRYGLAGVKVPTLQGSSFIGALTKSEARIDLIRRLFDALQGAPDVLDEKQKLAWLHLHVLHAGSPSEAALKHVPLLLERPLSAGLAHRFMQVWTTTLARAKQWQHANTELLRRYTDKELQIARLRGELDAVRQDARLNTAQAARAIVHEMERGSLVAAKAAAAVHRQAELERRLAEKESELQAIRGSASWRAMQPLRTWASRHPRLARRARQAAKLAFWTAKLTVVRRVREVLRQRAQNRHANAIGTAVRTGELPDVKLLPVAGFFPEKHDAWEYDVWPTGRPLISVVIPCFNYGHLVAEAIRSVEEQTLSDIEIIVVEGGSDSVESRRGFISLAENAPKRVRVLLQEKPHRAGANRNFGISHARGKYICCLDADDRLAPTYLEKSLFLLEYYSYDVVSPALQFFGDRNDVWRPPEDRPTLHDLLEGNQVLTCAVFRRSLWETAGGFRDSDPATGHVHEDWLFWTRLAALGAHFQNIREPLLFYRSHGQSLSTSAGVLETSQQKYYMAKFNADVLARPGHRVSQSQADAPSINPMRNLARLHEDFQRSPSLLLTMPYLVLGGAERLLSSVVAHLVDQGWHITIVTTVTPDESQGDTTQWFSLLGVAIYHFPRFLPQERWKDFTDYLFATRQFDVLWIVGSTFFYDYLPALKGNYPQLRVADLLFNSVGHTASNRRYARYIDINLVENRDVRRWLIAAGEIGDRIETVPSGVDLAKYSPAEKNLELLLQHGISADSIIVGFAGRWSEEKDPLGVIEIAIRISPEIPVVFVMTGAGPMADQVAARVQEAALPPGRIVICGAVPDIAVYLRSYDILLLPSRIDGRPNVVMEALACGVAVVASRVGALSELVDDGVQGYLCEPGAYEQFASRISELAGDRARLSKFKRAAREQAERNFNMRDMQVGYARVLEKLIERLPD